MFLGAAMSLNFSGGSLDNERSRQETRTGQSHVSLRCGAIEFIQGTH